MIDDALRACRLSMRFSPDSDSKNVLFFLMDSMAKQFCAELSEGLQKSQISFTFVGAGDKQAGVIYSYNLIYVTCGMFNTLCHVAAKIVDKGIYNDIGSASKVDANFDSIDNVLTAREILDKEDTFIWDEMHFPWKSDKEKQFLFFYILDTMFKFLLLHEMGHLFHGHGNNQERKYSRNVETDSIDGDSRCSDGIDSQARELVADVFAFDLLVKLQLEELKEKSTECMALFLKEKILKTHKESLIFFLDCVYLYFYMIDSYKWKGKNLRDNSHPPAAFRLQTIYSSVLPNIEDILHVDEMLVLKDAYRRSNITAARIFDRSPDYDWLGSMDSPQYVELYTDIYNRVPNWTAKFI